MNTSRTYKYKNKSRTVLLSIFFYVLQVLVPAGYMPASLAQEGALIKLCPSGVSDAVMAVLHKGHNSHNGHANAESNDPHKSHNAIQSSTMHSQHHQHTHHQYADHHGHHQLNQGGDSHSASEHYGSYKDSNHTTHHDDNNAGHSATSLCDYASASFSSDLALLKSTHTEEIEQSFFKQQLITHSNIVSLLHRKQRSRAPPFA